MGPALCFLGSAAVAVTFNAPARALPGCGLLGVVAWYGQVGLVARGLSVVGSNFAAAFIVALLAELFARFHRLPVTCFAVPGVIPLVPGFSAYNAMYGYVTDQFTKANYALLQTFMIAGAISAALAIAGSVVNMLPGQKPWRNPQSPIDDTLLKSGAIPVIVGAPGEAPSTPPPGSG